MATGLIPTHLASPIPPGSPSTEPSPKSDEYEDARTQFGSSRSNSTSSRPEDHNDDPEPPYSLVPPDGEIYYTNYLAHDHSPVPSSEEDLDAPALPIFHNDTWYRLHPSNDASLAIDVINDGRAHIDGNLNLAPTGRFSGQFWNIRPAESDDPRHGSPLYVLATMYLGASMVLTAGAPVRLAPYQFDGFGWVYHSQHWRISEHADGTYTFTAGYGFEGGGRAVTLKAWGQGLVVGETDSEGTSSSIDRTLWRVEPYQTMSDQGGFWTPG